MITAMGIAICGEDTGLFGAHRSGPGVQNRMKALPLWEDSYCGFRPQEIIKSGGNPDDVYFRGLAFRCVWYLYYDTERQILAWNQGDHDPSDAPTVWQLSVLRAARLAYRHKLNQTVLPGESGVIFEHGDQACVWAFQDLPSIPFKFSSVKELVSGKIFALPEFDGFKKHGIYELSA